MFWAESLTHSRLRLRCRIAQCAARQQQKQKHWSGVGCEKTGRFPVWVYQPGFKKKKKKIQGCPRGCINWQVAAKLKDASALCCRFFQTGLRTAARRTTATFFRRRRRKQTGATAGFYLSFSPCWSWSISLALRSAWTAPPAAQWAPSATWATE